MITDYSISLSSASGPAAGILRVAIKCGSDRDFKPDPAVHALLQAVAVEPAQRKKHCARGGSILYPEETIREELDNSHLKPLPLAEGGERVGTL